MFPDVSSKLKLSMSAGGLENPAAASAVGLASQDSTRPDCVSVTHIRYEKCITHQSHHEMLDTLSFGCYAELHAKVQFQILTS